MSLLVLTLRKKRKTRLVCGDHGDCVGSEARVERGRDRLRARRWKRHRVLGGEGDRGWWMRFGEVEIGRRVSVLKGMRWAVLWWMKR